MTASLGNLVNAELQPKANIFWSAVKGLHYWSSETTGPPSSVHSGLQNYVFLFTRNISHMHPQVPTKFRIKVRDDGVYAHRARRDFVGNTEPETFQLLGVTPRANAHIILSAGLPAVGTDGQVIDFNSSFDINGTLNLVDEYYGSTKERHFEHVRNSFQTSVLVAGDGSGAAGAGGQSGSGYAGTWPSVNELDFIGKWIDIPHAPLIVGDQLAIFCGFQYLLTRIQNYTRMFSFNNTRDPAEVFVSIDLITQDFPMSNEERYWVSKRLNQDASALNLYKMAQFAIP